MTKYVIVNEDYLQHHGILGMHWGIRRFQPYPKGSKKGKEVGAAKKVKQRNPSFFEKRKIKKEQKKKHEEFKKLRQEQENQYNKVRNDPKAESMVQKVNEQRKQKAIASGDVSKILKYKDQMSNEELRKAIERTKLLNELSGLSNSTKQKAKNNFDKAVNKSKKDNRSRYDKTLNFMNKTNKLTTAGLLMYRNTDQIIKIAKDLKSKKDKS